MVFIFEKEANYSVIQYCNFFHIVEGDFFAIQYSFLPTEHMYVCATGSLSNLAPVTKTES